MLMPTISPRHIADDELDRLLRPAKHYKYPKDVVADPTISLSEKRAILSAWVSDACTVESIPSLRIAPWSSAPVSFDEVMSALQLLDRTQERPLEEHKRRKRSGSDAAPM